MNLNDRPHQKHSPSRLAMYAKCPGWISDGQPPGPLAERGTRVGEILAAYAVDGVDPLDGADPEDLDALQYGVELIDQLKRASDTMVWTAEDFIATGIDHVGGYMDLTARDDFLGEAILVEFKTGRADREKAIDNAQVTAYALGLLEDGIQTVWCHLVELDKRTVTQVTYYAQDAERLSARVQALVDAAETVTDADLRPGPQCKYCGRQEQCPAYSQTPQMALAAIGERTLSPKDYAAHLAPEDLSEALRRVLPLVKMADDYAGALKQRAMTIIEAGGEIPGWMVKHIAGTRSWEGDEQSIYEALIAAYPEAAERIVVLRSPAQVEKILGKGAKEFIGRHTRQGQRKSLIEVS